MASGNGSTSTATTRNAERRSLPGADCVPLSLAPDRNLDVLAVGFELRPEGGAAGDNVGQCLCLLAERRDERLVLVVVPHELERGARDLAAFERDPHQQPGPLAVHAAMAGMERQVAKAVEDR